MMWKDSYRLGVDRIDNQHIELFRMTDELVVAARDGAPVETCQKILSFLKDYVIYHFRDEEAYQASVGYQGIEAHKAEHRQFTKTVLDYEKQLEANGFSQKTMKDLAGNVTAWLIYHVVDTDQKILSGEQAAEEEKFFDRYVDLFADSALEVIGSMAGIDRADARLQMTSPYRPEGEIFVRLGLIGDLAGEVVFGFKKGLALSLLSSMTGMELTELDELVQSALCELTNIACGNAATALAGRGLACDIKPPVLETAFSGGADGTGARIELPGGRLSIGVLL